MHRGEGGRRGLAISVSTPFVALSARVIHFRKSSLRVALCTTILSPCVGDTKQRGVPLSSWRITLWYDRLSAYYTWCAILAGLNRFFSSERISWKYSVSFCRKLFRCLGLIRSSSISCDLEITRLCRYFRNACCFVILLQNLLRYSGYDNKVSCKRISWTLMVSRNLFSCQELFNYTDLILWSSMIVV